MIKRAVHQGRDDYNKLNSRGTIEKYSLHRLVDKVKTGFKALSYKVELKLDELDIDGRGDLYYRLEISDNMSFSKISGFTSEKNMYIAILGYAHFNKLMMGSSNVSEEFNRFMDKHVHNKEAIAMTNMSDRERSSYVNLLVFYTYLQEAIKMLN